MQKGGLSSSHSHLLKPPLSHLLLWGFHLSQLMESDVTVLCAKVIEAQHNGELTSLPKTLFPLVDRLNA